MSRTLEIVESYDGVYDATLLVNCLLGLIIVPKESLIDSIPEEPFEKISNWGINPASIKEFGNCDHGHEQKPNLRQLVRRLRNAVAHFKIDPVHKMTEVVGFRFKDRNGFKAEITLKEMHDFSIRLAKHLSV
ncbi:HEPN [compost metagenome]